MIKSAHIEQKVALHGHYRLIEADPEKAPVEYGELLDFLRNRPIQAISKDDIAERASHRAEFNRLVGAYHSKATVAIHEFDNLVPIVGENVLARLLEGDATYSGEINYLALGSSGVAPADGDTELGTETYRQLKSSSTTVNNITYISCFIQAGDATGTHVEGGLFIDGNGSADTGQMFSHVLFSPNIVKGALNSLTLDVTITIG